VVEETPPEPLLPAQDGIFYTVKVMLCTGLSDFDDSRHLSKRLKFLVLKKDHSQLLCVGGPYNQQVDGLGDWNPSDPSNTDPDFGFKRAAIRHCVDQLDLDLSRVTKWWRFIDIKYDRPRGLEDETPHHNQSSSSFSAFRDFEVLRDNVPSHVSILFVVSLWDIVPSREEFVDAWKGRELIKLERKREKDLQAKIAIENAKRDKMRRDLEKQAEKQSLDATDKDNYTNYTDNNHTPEEDPKLEEMTTPEEPTIATIVTDINNDDTSSTLVPPPLTTATPTDPSLVAPLNPDDLKHLQELDLLLPPLVVDMENTPKDIYIFVSGKRVKYQHTKCALLSLDGLLDYDLNDNTEGTFEVSLFAESFADLLQRDFGYALAHLLTSLYSEKSTSSTDAISNHIQSSEKQSTLNNGKEHHVNFNINLNLNSDVIAEPTISPATHNITDDNNRSQQEREVSTTPPTTEEQTTEDQPQQQTEPHPVNEQTEGEMILDQEHTENGETATSSRLNDDDNNSGKSDKKRKREGTDEDKPVVKKMRAEGEPKLEVLFSFFFHRKNQFLTIPQDTPNNDTDPDSDPEKKKNLNPFLLQAFQFFDRRQVGYIKDTDLELLFFTLGLRISRSDTKHLVDTLWKSNQSRLYYEPLIEKK